MPNPCGQVHMPNFPCRECDRIRAKPHINDARKAVAEKREVRRKIDATLEPSKDRQPAAVSVSDAASVPDSVESGGKPDRLEVAKEALSAAERQRKFREKDPEAYRKWNRERMRALRKKK